jgi:hypothetical protein
MWTDQVDADGLAGRLAVHRTDNYDCIANPMFLNGY